MLGDTDSLLAKGEQDKAKGEKLKARMNFETAAKIEIYQQNKHDLEKCLRLAKEVTENEDPDLALLDTMLANMDKVLRVSKLYFDQAARRDV